VAQGGRGAPKFKKKIKKNYKKIKIKKKIIK
jgi:hypothetical protein